MPLDVEQLLTRAYSTAVEYSTAFDTEDPVALERVDDVLEPQMEELVAKLRRLQDRWPAPLADVALRWCRAQEERQELDGEDDHECEEADDRFDEATDELGVALGIEGARSRRDRRREVRAANAEQRAETVRSRPVVARKHAAFLVKAARAILGGTKDELLRMNLSTVADRMLERVGALPEHDAIVEPVRRLCAVLLEHARSRAEETRTSVRLEGAIRDVENVLATPSPGEL